jgi:hypothetical protein
MLSGPHQRILPPCPKAVGHSVVLVGVLSAECQADVDLGQIEGFLL